MRILAIETSCDETAVAIIETEKNGDFKILANIISSQIKVHQKFGGVVPNLARREHEKNLSHVLENSLSNAKLLKIKKILSKASETHLKTAGSLLLREKKLKNKLIKLLRTIEKPDLDYLAITKGPGLAPALWTGVNCIKALSEYWSIPIIPINHMEGHIVSALIETKPTKSIDGFPKIFLKKLITPTIALLVSGGHTELHLIKKYGNYKRLGDTLDDAAGEAFDKVAKMLGLKYPGGPEISRLANLGIRNAIPFPRPLLNKNNFNFSFSGLKTSVLYYLRDNPKYNKEDVAASFETAVVETLVQKTFRALEEFEAKSILIGGGVAANNYLRDCIKKTAKAKLKSLPIYMPLLSNSGDNALMIALAASKKLKNAIKQTALNATANWQLEIY